MSKIFFTSDLHLWHVNLLKFCPNTRKGSTELEMNEFLRETWNEQVSPEDTVYLLGDISWGTTADTIEFLNLLNGVKHLVLGNHDTRINHSSYKGVFASINIYREIKIDGINIVLFHFPIIEWNKMHHGSYHLYGHVHGKELRAMGGRSMDVGIDARPTGDMKLWTWEEIHEILSKKPILFHHYGDTP
jgi:calcineurin-like phosphoesterase family protein